MLSNLIPSSRRHLAAFSFPNTFEGFFHNALRQMDGSACVPESFSPRLDVQDLGEVYRVTAELPGLSEADVEASLEDNVLTIKGEKKSEREETAEGRFYSERSYGAFSRSLRLPVNVDAEKVDAVHKDGLLTITLPKAVADKPRKIEVKRES